MSVICKVSISEIRNFGNDRLIKTNCVAENEVMAHYNPDEEDRLFSQYSPSGSADFIAKAGVCLPAALDSFGKKLYLVFVQEDEKPDFPKAVCYAKLRVNSMTDYGGQSKQYDIGTYGNITTDYRCCDRFHHKIMIDNPPAAEQFVPGASNWWVAVYDADTHTMRETIDLAHS